MKPQSIGQILAVLIFAFPFVLNSSPAAAWQTFSFPNNYHLTGGVNGRQYYFTASVGAALENFAYSGKWYWGDTMANHPDSNGPVAWGETTNINNAEMVWYQNETIDDGSCANTTMFGSNTNQVGPSASNWAYAKVNVMERFFGHYLCVENQQGTITHEIGHVMGLNHEDYNIPATIMRSEISMPTLCCSTEIWHRPKRDDVFGINAIFYP